LAGSVTHNTELGHEPRAGLLLEAPREQDNVDERKHGEDGPQPIRAVRRNVRVGARGRVALKRIVAARDEMGEVGEGRHREMWRMGVAMG